MSMAFWREDSVLWRRDQWWRIAMIGCCLCYFSVSIYSERIPRGCNVSVGGFGLRNMPETEIRLFSFSGTQNYEIL